MHKSSLENMRRFVDHYLVDWVELPITIVDIGSQNVNGTYKQFFEKPGWAYTGVDASPGKNVDIVLSDLYAWKEIPNSFADVVISGQAFEHIEYFWLTMAEIARIMKPGGVLCLIAPSSGTEHRYPVDCWRFYPDGMRALARYVRLEVLEAYAQRDKEKYSDMDPMWKDCVLVARKPNTRPNERPPDKTPLRWHIDSISPDSEVVGRCVIRGWVLPDDNKQAHLAVRVDGQTRCYPLNADRPDIVRKILGEEPMESPKLCCGFEYAMQVSDTLRVGFEVNGQIHWVHSQEMAEKK